MIAFAILAGLMLAGALLWVLAPLFGLRGQTTAARERQRQTETALAVLREQLAELDGERAAGRVDDTAYARSREELERRALEEGEGDEGQAREGAARGWGLAMVVLVPLSAALVYLSIGAPAALDPAAASAREGFTAAEIEDMVSSLAARLEQEPDNVEGWNMLARSYLVLEDFPRALATYARLAELRPQDPDVLADWADVMAATRDGDVTGEPAALVERALAVDPQHIKALALAGTAAFQSDDFAGAAAYWERILARVPAGNEMAASIRASINEARLRGGLPTLDEAPPPAAPAAGGGALSLSGRLQIDDAVRERAAPGDVVFVFVRGVDGGMPLAALRYTVAELPLAFSFDGVALMGGPDMAVPASLSVIARVSRSGDATPRAGDLEGRVDGVAASASGVYVVIDRVRE